MLEDNLTLSGKKILITGASSGIGKACAILASSLGAQVTIMARDEKRLNEVFDMLQGQDHSYHLHDFSMNQGLESIVYDMVEKNGPFSGMIYCAGIELTKAFRLTNENDLNKLLQINTISAFTLCRILGKKGFYDLCGSSFVLLGSVAALTGRVGQVAYSASKGALLAGCRSVALELADKKIRVNTISPGLVETPMVKDYLERLSPEQRVQREKMYPLGIGESQDIANAACFLLTDAAQWITGTNLVVDGGYYSR